MAMQHARYRVVLQAEMVRHAKRLGGRGRTGSGTARLGRGGCDAQVGRSGSVLKGVGGLISGVIKGREAEFLRRASSLLSRESKGVEEEQKKKMDAVEEKRRGASHRGVGKRTRRGGQSQKPKVDNARFSGRMNMLRIFLAMTSLCSLCARRYDLLRRLLLVCPRPTRTRSFDFCSPLPLFSPKLPPMAASVRQVPRPNKPKGATQRSRRRGRHAAQPPGREN
jgi:hypothetical protein